MMSHYMWSCLWFLLFLQQRTHNAMREHINMLDINPLNGKVSNDLLPDSPSWLLLPFSPILSLLPAPCPPASALSYSQAFLISLPICLSSLQSLFFSLYFFSISSIPLFSLNPRTLYGLNANTTPLSTITTIIFISLVLLVHPQNSQTLHLQTIYSQLMFHTERVYTLSKKGYPKQSTGRGEPTSVLCENVKRSKVKSTVHRNRKLFSSSSPFVNIKKDVMPKPLYKTSTHSLAMTRGMRTQHDQSMNFQNQTEQSLPSNSLPHPLSLFLKLSSNNNHFNYKQSLESSARNKFLELTSERKKQVSVSVAPKEHSQEVRKFLDEQQLVDCKKKVSIKQIKPWGRYLTKASESSREITRNQGDEMRISEYSDLGMSRSRMYKHGYKEDKRRAEPVRPIYDLFKVKDRDSEREEPFVIAEQGEKENGATIEAQRAKEIEEKEREREKERQKERDKERQRERLAIQQQQRERQRQKQRQAQRERQRLRQRQEQAAREREREILREREIKSTKPNQNPFPKIKQSPRDQKQSISISSQIKPTIDISSLLSTKKPHQKQILQFKQLQDNHMIQRVRPFHNHIEEIEMSPIHHSKVNIRKIVSEHSNEMFDDFDDDLENIVLEKGTTSHIQQAKAPQVTDAQLSFHKAKQNGQEARKQREKEKAKEKQKELEGYKQQIQDKEKRLRQEQQLAKPSKKQSSKPQNLVIQKQELPPESKHSETEEELQEDIYLDRIQKHLDMVDILGEYYKVAKQTYSQIEYAWEINGFWLYKKFAYEREKVLVAMKGGENCFTIEGMDIQDSKLNDLIQLESIIQYTSELESEVKQIKEGLFERNKRACKLNPKLKGSMDLLIDPYFQVIKCLGEQYNFLTKILQSQGNNKGLYSRIVYVAELIFIIENLNGNFVKEWEEATEQDLEGLKKYVSKYKSMVEKIIRRM